MDSRVAYLNIWQVLSDVALSTAPEAVRNVAHKRIPTIEECSAPLAVHVARNCISGNNVFDISHITWEFQSIQGMFFSCATFDGTGPYGTGPGKFALPGQKINYAQKALILLTLMEYCMTEWEDALGPLVEGDFNRFKAKVQQEFDGGVSDLSTNYDQISRVSRNIIAGHLNGGKFISRA